tara:strand:+ start:102 stop:548 length:447 start_codon:yes stop_codon:yes gene_type:complete
MTASRASQLNLIGALFLVLGLISIFNLAILRNIGDQLKANSEMTANLTSLEGTKPESSDQFDSMANSMVMGMFIVSITFTLVCFLTGGCLLKRISYRTCLVGAAVTCIIFPVGTVLGAWAIFVLTARDTKSLFEDMASDSRTETVTET